MLLTASIVLGVLTTARWRTPRWPRFALSAVHRNLTLLTLVFVVVHVLTTLLDGYAPIRLFDAVIPFVSAYRPVWLGLGAVAFDLLLALVVTSLLRTRLGYRLWRQIHWLAYASWPVALVHALGTGSDGRAGFMLLAGFGSIAVVVLAVLARVAVGPGRQLPVRAGAAVAALITPLAIVAWYESGPSKHGWARRAGTPTTLLAARHTSARRVSVAQPIRTSFSAKLVGHISESTNASGLVDVAITGKLNRGRIGAVRIDLLGEPLQGGVSMTASGVSYVPAGTRTVYEGSVTTLDGRDRRRTGGDRIEPVSVAVQPERRRGGGNGQRLGQRRSLGERMTNGRLLAGIDSHGRMVSLTEHVARHGPLRLDADLIATTTASGLKGRGGGAFPTGEKLRAVAGRSGRPVIVLNGAEGEPASRKDKLLLGAVPHLALDGAAAAAAALGSHEVVVAVGRAARNERAILATALKERRDPLRWRLAVVPDGFVSGEETALLSSLAGRAPKPAVKPPYPFERGLGGAPTLVQNAETLAQIALIARHGAGWFRSLGTEREPGTALVTLSGAVARPGVYEIELGSTIAKLVAQRRRGHRAGGRVSRRRLLRRVDPRQRLALTAASGLGAGVVVAFPDSACALRESARVARYLAGESAGQCGPCLHGLAALAGGLEQLAAGNDGDRPQLARWAERRRRTRRVPSPRRRSSFISSTLAVFEHETADHLRDRCRRPDRGVLPVA